MRGFFEKGLGIIRAGLILFVSHHGYLLFQSNDYWNERLSSRTGLFVQHKDWDAR